MVTAQDPDPGVPPTTRNVRHRQGSAFSSIPTASTPPRLPPTMTGRRHETPRSSLPAPHGPHRPSSTFLVSQHVPLGSRPPGARNPGSPHARRHPCLSGGIFQSLPPPLNHHPLWAFPAPSPCTCRATPGTSHPASRSGRLFLDPGLCPVAPCLARVLPAGEHPLPGLASVSGPDQKQQAVPAPLPCPLLLCPRLPGQAPGWDVGSVPGGCHRQAGGAVSPAAPGAPAEGQGLHGTSPPPGLVETGLGLPPAAFPALTTMQSAQLHQIPTWSWARHPQPHKVCLCKGIESHSHLGLTASQVSSPSRGSAALKRWVTRPVWVIVRGVAVTGSHPERVRLFPLRTFHSLSWVHTQGPGMVPTACTWKCGFISQLRTC